MTTKTNTPPRFPSTVLTPVYNFLSARLNVLKKRKKEISKEDPFRDTDRVNDNAASDIEADEQFGHARVSAIGSAIGKQIIQLRKALTRIRIGKYGVCEVCGQMIDTDRLMIYPEATLCTKDARKREK
ncbi:MAG TPA: TraR/DksA C4-type zinc finger protein [Patescibacteria group bacterium]|nr:TraR/DksA C4-type zinc finger protein [Patescibacteria group bacterium]